MSKLANVGIEDVPEVVNEMAGYREWVDPLLDGVMADNSQSERKRVRVAIASLPATDEHVNWLTDRLVSEQLPPHEFLVIRDSLLPHADGIAEVLRRKLTEESLLPRQRLRVAAALAAYDNSPELWNPIAGEVAGRILREPATDATVWIEAMRPVADYIDRELSEQFDSVETLEAARIGAMALYRLDADHVRAIAARLPSSNGPRYRAIVELLKRDADALPAVRQQLQQLSAPGDSEFDAEAQAAMLANVILALYELGDAEPFLTYSQLAADPRVRTRLLHGATPDRIDLAVLMPLIRDTSPCDARAVALTAAYGHLDEPMPQSVRDELHAIL
ncbi:MAG: hypothetical protein ABI619_12855, partial [Betaproteobacteria bacterium]